MCPTVESWFKKDLKLQIHLHKTFFADNRFLDSVHKYFLNQTTLNLRMKKMGFLKYRFVWKCNWHYLNLLSLSKRSHKINYCLSLNKDSLSESGESAESANYIEKLDLEAKSWLESYRSKHQSHVVTATPSECRLRGSKTNSTLNNSTINHISGVFLYNLCSLISIIWGLVMFDS